MEVEDGGGAGQLQKRAEYEHLTQVVDEEVEEGLDRGDPERGEKFE